MTTFDAAGSAYCDRELELWPAERFATQIDDIHRWCARKASTEHPILRYFLATDDWWVIQITDVPAQVVSKDVTAAWIERGRQWGGVQHQLAMPLAQTRHGRRAFVVARPDPFTGAEMDLARQLRRLITGLDRHRAAFSRWSAAWDRRPATPCRTSGSPPVSSPSWRSWPKASPPRRSADGW